MGELARATGLSVRALRHWDEVGLVCPHRTAAGHRRYGRADVTRLYRALALRQMGLSLEQIRALLTETDPSPRATLHAHLDRVDADLAALQTLRERLVDVLAALDNPSGDGGATETTLLMKVIEKMTMFEQHLTADQRTWFARRREQVGAQAWQQAIDQWPELVTAVRERMDAGTDPTDPRVQALMDRWEELQRVFLGDSAEMRTISGRAWQDMWDQHPEQLRDSSRVAPPEMWDYIQRAQAGRTTAN